MLLKKACTGLFFSGILLLASCNSENKSKSTDEKENLLAQNFDETKKLFTVSKLISEDKGFETFAKWVEASDYYEKLSEKGPYTVFAPTNYAFENLYPGTVEKLTLPEEKEKVTSIIDYHVIPGLINENDIFKAIDDYGGSVKLKTLGGKRLTATKKNGKVYLIDEKGNGAQLITANIEAENGIIHTIDDIMLPKQKK